MEGTNNTTANSGLGSDFQYHHDKTIYVKTIVCISERVEDIVLRYSSRSPF